MARQSKKPADPTQGAGSPLAGPGNGHGGRRANSGPKPSLARRQITDVNAVTIAKITEWLPGLLNNLKTLADGFQLQKVDEKNGGVSYYTTAPDRQANEYLVNRLLGKPTERSEISGPGGDEILVVFEKAIINVYGSDEPK